MFILYDISVLLVFTYAKPSPVDRDDLQVRCKVVNQVNVPR